MEHLDSRIAYLRGLVSGLDVSRDGKEGRLIHEMIDVMDDMQEEIRFVREHQREQEEYLEALDFDLHDVESTVYEDADIDDVDDESTVEDAEEPSLFEMECPNCAETVVIDETVFDDERVAEVLCPECQEVLIVRDDEENGMEGFIMQSEEDELVHH